MARVKAPKAMPKETTRTGRNQTGGRSWSGSAFSQDGYMSSAVNPGGSGADG
jgi:hypothetical protein